LPESIRLDAHVLRFTIRPATAAVPPLELGLISGGPRRAAVPGLIS
jgi:hypothetical protein